MTNRFDKHELNSIISYLDSIRFNFVDYLKDAKHGIMTAIKNSSKWSSSYELDTYKLMNDLQNSNSKSNCTESISKETESLSFPFAKRPSHELDYDPEEFLLNLDLFNNSFNDLPPKSSRSTLNLFSKENNFEESEGVDEYDDEDFDDEDEGESSFNEVESSNKDSKTTRKKVKKMLKQKTTTDDLFDSSILSTRNDSNKKLSSTSKIKELTAGQTASKKQMVNKEEATKREQKRERRQKRRDRAAANDFYKFAFDNELTETSSESDTDSSARNEIVDSVTNSKHINIITNFNMILR